MALIEIRNVCKSFGDKDNKNTVLNNVSLSVRQGEFVSLMGASGSGKSTLLYLLGGLDTADSGEILIDGKNIASMSDKELSEKRRQDIGFVFQFFNLVQNLSVEDNILLPIVMDRKNPAMYKEKLDEILKITNLSDKRKSFPPQLSGGQQQRTAIARAVITEPKIILADEPTGNLDSKTGKEIMELFSRINKEKNITVIMITHSMECASFADKTIQLSDGRLD
jgi:putative ABC transport system ATP-binding protein